MLAELFACFQVLKFFNHVVVIVRRRFEIPKVSGASFDFSRTMLDEIFHLFVFSLQTPMYETDENKIDGNLRLQNARGNGTLGAPMFEENPSQLYPQLHILDNPMPISSNLLEALGNDLNVVHQLRKFPPIFNASTYGKSPVIQAVF